MALLKCPECGNQVSDKAASCPQCGHPVSEMQKSVRQAPIQQAKVKAEQATERKTKKGLKSITIIAGILILVLIIIGGVVGFMYLRSKAEEKKQMDAQQKIEAQRQEEEKDRQRMEEQRRMVEEQLHRQEEKKREEENQRRINAWKQIQVSDVNFSQPLIVGGIDLNSFTLINGTNYSFFGVSYEFYDVDDGTIKIASMVGPLLANQSQKFVINKHVEGLWGHRYGVHIRGGSVSN